MATITTRSGKGSPLTNTEVDSNFTNLNTDKVEKSGDSMTGNLTFGDNDKAIFGAGSDLQIYHHATDGSFIVDNGTGNLQIDANDFRVRKPDGSEAMIHANADGAVKLFYDGGATPKLATTSTGIDVTGTVTADRLVSIDTTGTNYSLIENRGSGVSKDTLVLRNYGSGTNATGQGVKLVLAPTANDVTNRNATIEAIQNGNNSIDMRFKTSAGSDPVERMRVTQNGDIYFFDPTGANASFVYDASTQLVVNEDSRDFDFRVESDANTHAFFVQGSDGNVGIGTSSPVSTSGVKALTVYAATDAPSLYLQNSTTGTAYTDGFSLGMSGTDVYFNNREAGNALFYVNGSERMRIDSSGNVGINETSPDSILHIRAVDPTVIIQDQNNSTGGTSYTPNISFRASDDNVVGRVGYVTNGTIFDIDSGNYNSSVIRFVTGGSQRAKFTSANIVFNDPGNDLDFRVESNNHTHGIWLDAANDRVNIMTTENAATLNIGGSADTELLRIDTGVNYQGIRLRVDSSYQSGRNIVLYPHTTPGSGTVNHYTRLESNVTATALNRHNLKVDGHIYTDCGIYTYGTFGSIFNENSNDADFRVESDANSNMIFVDASSNRIGFGTGSPSKTYDFRNGDVTIYGGEDGYNANGEKARLWIGNNNANVGAIFGTGLYLDPGNGAGDDAFQVRQGSGDVYLGSGSAGTKFIKLLGKSNGHIDIGGDITSSDNRIVFYNPNGLVGSIKTSSSGTTYNTTSDRRLKDNIETITDGTDKLMAMNPVTHTWKADPDAPAVHGFIAQEMQDVVPEAVSGEDGGDEMMSMDYGRITPVLVAALQDAHREIQNLKAEIAALKTAS